LTVFPPETDHVRIDSDIHFYNIETPDLVFLAFEIREPRGQHGPRLDGFLQTGIPVELSIDPTGFPLRVHDPITQNLPFHKTPCPRITILPNPFAKIRKFLVLVQPNVNHTSITHEISNPILDVTQNIPYIDFFLRNLAFEEFPIKKETL
jgi:hypothetical protein